MKFLSYCQAAAGVKPVAVFFGRFNVLNMLI
ncbi:MAG: hypothetical protein FD170_605 [Bacteroidetes bacterium]|nr:MAG: hypothetical protein FD170_605 [Bacteroidota bacterium]